MICCVKITIYDNVDNVVFEATSRTDNKTWNLTNLASRSVANGGYLVIAEIKGDKGTYTYSAKVGVRR